MSTVEAFYTPNEVASHLGLHVRTIRRFIHEGQLKASRVGKQFRISENELKRLLGTKGKRATNATVDRCRITASSTIDIHSISKKDQERLTNLLLGAFQSRGGPREERRFDAIYYEQEMRLRILVNADLDVSNAIFGLIRGVLGG